MIGPSTSPRSARSASSPVSAARSAPPGSRRRLGARRGLLAASSVALRRRLRGGSARGAHRRAGPASGSARRLDRARPSAPSSAGCSGSGRRLGLGRLGGSASRARLRRRFGACRSAFGLPTSRRPWPSAASRSPASAPVRRPSASGPPGAAGSAPGAGSAVWLARSRANERVDRGARVLGIRGLGRAARRGTRVRGGASTTRLALEIDLDRALVTFGARDSSISSSPSTGGTEIARRRSGELGVRARLDLRRARRSRRRACASRRGTRRATGRDRCAARRPAPAATSGGGRGRRARARAPCAPRRRARDSSSSRSRSPSAAACSRLLAEHVGLARSWSRAAPRARARPCSRCCGRRCASASCSSSVARRSAVLACASSACCSASSRTARPLPGPRRPAPPARSSARLRISSAASWADRSTRAVSSPSAFEQLLLGDRRRVRAAAPAAPRSGGSSSASRSRIADELVGDPAQEVADLGLRDPTERAREPAVR